MKTVLQIFLLALSALGAWAQPAPGPAPTLTTNREEALRQALRQAISGQPASPGTGVATATNVSPAPTVTTVIPVVTDANPAPAPEPVAVTANPAASPATPLAVPGTRTNVAPSAAIAAPAPAIPAPGTTPAPVVPADSAAPALPSANQPPGLSTTPAGATAPAEEMFPAGLINFPAVDIAEVMKVYAELVGRTILRPTTLPAGPITLKTQTPLTKKEAIQALDAVLALNGVSVIPVGEKFIKVVPSAQANQTGAPFNEQDAKDLPEMGSYVTHVVQTKYVKPTELVQVLQPFASAIPNPILAIDGSQMLVLRDYAENVKRMLELVAKIDVAVPAEYISEVIPIKYALASEISAALNSLSAGGGGTSIGQGGAAGAGAAPGGANAARRSAFGTGGQRGLGGVGGYGGVNQPFGQQAQTGVGGMATPGAGGNFSDRLRSIIQRASTTGEIQVIGQTKIIADERTNSLLIFASRTDMETIKKIISQLDVVLAQVLIETVIIEVTLGPDSKNFGFSYLQHPQNVGKFTGVGSAGAGQFLSPGSFAGAVGTNATSGLAGGFNYLFSYGQDLDVTVTALESSSRGKILQRPRIQTSHAVPATIFVGESRPYPQGSYYGGGSFGGYSTIQQLSIGVTLDVTPLINPDGLVVMDIHQTIENYAGFTTISGVGDVPITTRKEAQAKVAVRDRDTIMLGGLIETDKTKSGSGVPFLMDIPLLGYLFRSSSSSETRKELIVLIRPTVLPTPEIAALAAKAEKERMPGVQQTEREILDEEAQRFRSARPKGP